MIQVRLLTVVAMLVGAAVVASYSYTMFLFLTPPMYTTETAIETAEVKYSAPVIMKQVFHRDRYCKTDIDRFVIRQSDSMLMRRERLTGQAGGIGDSVVRILIPTKLPPQTSVILGISDLAAQDLLPGHSYTLRIVVHSECGDRTHTFAIPDMSFKVVE